MLFKNVIFLTAIYLTSSNCYANEREITPTPVEAAIADTVTTIIAINGGAVEINPLGLGALTILKVGLVLVVNERLEGNDKYMLEKAESTIWTGASVNNLFVILNASPVTAVAAGIITALIVWHAN
jgi:hypothetical protein